MPCEVCVEADAGVYCGDTAPYEAHGLAVCADHAWHALDDGAEVIGPYGHHCWLGEDGEIVEAQR